MKCAILLLIGCITAHLCFAQNGNFRELEPQSNATTDFYRQKLSDQVMKQLNKIDWGHVDRTTAPGSVLYTVPVVVHVLHNYGVELVPDSAIVTMISEINSYFLKTRPDTANIIDKYKSIAANTQIAFKLATIDPNGNQTKGIDHIATYLTYYQRWMPDQAKVNQWPQERYLNIWLVTSSNAATTIANGYSYNSYDAAYQPYYDGDCIVLCTY